MKSLEGVTEKTIKEYIEEAMKTANSEAIEDFATYSELYLMEESGEFLGLLKKIHYHNLDIPKEKLINEIGDILWGYAFVSKFHKENKYKYFNLDFQLNSKNEHQTIKTILQTSEIFLEDIAWYSNYKGISIKECMDKNIQKIRTRYPDGYSHKACGERVDVNG